MNEQSKKLQLDITKNDRIISSATVSLENATDSFDRKNQELQSKLKVLKKLCRNDTFESVLTHYVEQVAECRT